MRIVHFSDIHLSESNLTELENYFRDALIKKLKELNSSIRVDLILVTGDLVDQGGKSLKNLLSKAGVDSHFKFFEKKFIDPICEGLSLSKNNFLIVPGNHDVDESKINWIEEKKLAHDKIRFLSETHEGETYLTENTLEKNKYKNSQRIKEFKEFEYDFHFNNPKMYYRFTENESSFIYQCKYTKTKVGFILVNDSWLCKSLGFKGECKRIYFGVQQLHDSLNWLDSQNTNLNFCLMHHSFDDYMEQEEIERFFRNKNVSVVFNGHYHEQDFRSLSYKNGSFLVFRVGAGLLRPKEKEHNYKPGFQVIDFDLSVGTVSDFHYFTYNYPDAIFERVETDLNLNAPIKLRMNKRESARGDIFNVNIDDVNDFVL